MKLAAPFYRLPFKIDVARLQYEVSLFELSDWKRHPSGFAGNSAIRLISVDGGPSDDFAGPMAPTPELQRASYIRQILGAFEVVWSRSRLMRLEPGASVPEHCDLNYHWFNRVRVHIPIQTDPSVSFTCGGQSVHMAAGEVWLFDNWRMHSVHNASQRERIHLVADTTGNAGFWDLLDVSDTSRFDQPQVNVRLIPFESDVEVHPWCERFNTTVIMHPAEVDLLTRDLLDDLSDFPGKDGKSASASFAGLVLNFSREWRMLWSMFADTQEGWPHFRKLRNWAVEQNRQQSPLVVCRSNGMPASEVFHPRVLIYAYQAPDYDANLSDFDRTLAPVPDAESAPDIRM